MAEKTTFESGAVRDSDAGKPRYDLIPPGFLSALIHADVDAYTVDAICYALHASEDKLTTEGTAALEWAAIVLNAMSAYDLTLDESSLPVLPPDAVRRLAVRLADGVKTYGENNWQKGMDVNRTYQSLLRHMYGWSAQHYYGIDDGEDHAAAALFNLMSLWWDLGGNGGL